MFDNGRWLLTNRPPVVVLADKKKAQMDEAVHEMLRCAHKAYKYILLTRRCTVICCGAQVLSAWVLNIARLHCTSAEGLPWQACLMPRGCRVAHNQSGYVFAAAVCLCRRDRGLHLEVHTREGNPFKLSELKRVSCTAHPWCAVTGLFRLQ
jgi:hypothetical protein